MWRLMKGKLKPQVWYCLCLKKYAVLIPSTINSTRFILDITNSKLLWNHSYSCLFPAVWNFIHHIFFFFLNLCLFVFILLSCVHDSFSVSTSGRELMAKRQLFWFSNNFALFTTKAIKCWRDLLASCLMRSGILQRWFFTGPKFPLLKAGISFILDVFVRFFLDICCLWGWSRWNYFIFVSSFHVLPC